MVRMTHGMTRPHYASTDSMALRTPKRRRLARSRVRCRRARRTASRSRRKAIGVVAPHLLRDDQSEQQDRVRFVQHDRRGRAAARARAPAGSPPLTTSRPWPAPAARGPAIDWPIRGCRAIGDHAGLRIDAAPETDRRRQRERRRGRRRSGQQHFSAELRHDARSEDRNARDRALDAVGHRSVQHRIPGVRRRVVRELSGVRHQDRARFLRQDRRHHHARVGDDDDAARSRAPADVRRARECAARAVRCRRRSAPRACRPFNSRRSVSNSSSDRCGLPIATASMRSARSAVDSRRCASRTISS